jgi:hypothetical protein
MGCLENVVWECWGTIVAHEQYGGTGTGEIEDTTASSQ